MTSSTASINKNRPVPIFLELAFCYFLTWFSLIPKLVVFHPFLNLLIGHVEVAFLFIIFFMFRLCLSKFILTCTDAGDDTTVDEQIGACDETGMLSQQEGCCLGNLVAGTCTLGG